MQRKFTVYTQENSMLLKFAIEDLKKMQLEYPEVYDELFMEQAELLREVLTSKMYATQQLESQKLLKKELEENKERQG